jgi:hypothetical protein
LKFPQKEERRKAQTQHENMLRLRFAAFFFEILFS